jgi:ribosomal protein S8
MVTKDFDLDTPWSNQKESIRMLMKNEGFLEQLSNLWRQEYVPGKTFQSVRAFFKLIDIPTFPQHQWFKTLFALPPKQRTKERFRTEFVKYIQPLTVYFFSNPRRVALFKKALYPLTYWCEHHRGGDYALHKADVMTEFVKWYLEDKAPRNSKLIHKPMMKNIALSRYNYIKAHVWFWNSVMEIQGYYDPPTKTRTKINDAVTLTEDGSFKMYRALLWNMSNNFIRDQNLTVAESRFETKILSPIHVKQFVNNFNAIQEYYKGTPHGQRMALTEYAILSLNFNLGFRSLTACKMCYSWMKYVEERGVCGGIYLYIGNPLGLKVRGLAKFTFAQFLVRYIDVRQCTIGSIIKIIVAEHDILGDTSLLDSIEKSIKERESYIRSNITSEPPTSPKWHDYVILKGQNRTTPISSSTYSTKVDGMYGKIGASYMQAVTHEPHNRVPNDMKKVGLDTKEISGYMAWATENATLFEKLYKHGGIDIKAALARGGYRGCNLPYPMYECPRDGLDDDFDEYQDIRKLVLNNRVPDLLRRAQAVEKALPANNGLRTTIIFLELLDKFLIRVWLEDAAILQPQKHFTNSICYKNHPVFQHPRWPKLVKHLAKLREDRGDTNKTGIYEETMIQLPPAHVPTNPQDKELFDLMRVNHNDATIESLYTWRATLQQKWKQQNKGSRGIPYDLWYQARAIHNKNLYSDISRICKYVDAVVKETDFDLSTVLELLQLVANDLGFLDHMTRNFAETQFRIVTSLGENSDEAVLLDINWEELVEALQQYDLPAPPKPK